MRIKKCCGTLQHTGAAGVSSPPLSLVNEVPDVVCKGVGIDNPYCRI